MIIGNLEFKGKLDGHGKLRLTIRNGEIIAEIDRDAALEIITHLFNVFELEIYASIIPKSPS